ncbi:putative ribulose-1,5 bisphosphate carboxylase/oxygenase small subunit N-methyltransferase I [Phytophthora sojae]|uniref:Ribulose-1,5 bisphosphate carboxylase/oxygenase small subunit N-methyltransferase I n=1 Tax=Phytophthora sojae (strain P6497) TaxID=1094619 RepID=G4Z5S6_PHYSP|nr:putative ribulose-1,5 bisphosphate carboxylase/oxygenase small subunit N-methyltransferase I [Phytophthora sojae]EGZ19509.1 putative ribulose-1,5 bisphosphate carboxylase/oxygenase small subunit N-methyltransferase I [Phytophthora sojae]|eukprot:XP_009522226.1 putative ribulose-1,5 bisphosphate carboxylase/oxygenase small subunit N-methyltransferase I [Phytophthora sojae]
MIGVTDENVREMVSPMFVYALLEFISFVILVMITKRNCGIQVVYQLAFVLETQMAPILTKLVLWMLVTLTYRIDHFVIPEKPLIKPSCSRMVSLLSVFSLLLLYGGRSASPLSIDASPDVVAAARPDVEVEFDLDPDSKAEWGGYAASRSDRPVLEGRTAFPDGSPVGINIRPIGGAAKVESPTSSVLKAEGFNFGRGMAYTVTEDVEQGAELLSLPMSKVMSVASAARGRVGLLLEVNPDLPPAIALGLHLLEEQALGAKSNFSEFVSSLPGVEAINSTLFYSENQLKEMEGSQLLRYTLGRAQAVEAFYDALLQPVTSPEAVDPPIFKEQDFTLDKFRWAMGVVWASAFPVGEDEADVVLAPVLDTIGICTDVADEGDEACPPNQIEVDQSSQRLVVHASSPLEKGREVRLSMPGKSSAQFMLNNGFARDRASKKLDKLDLTVTLDPSDALASVKSYLLHTQLNESVNASYALFHGSSKIDDEISKSLKMKLLSGAELSRFKELLDPKEEAEKRNILSLRNEFVFTRAIMSTCTTLLQQYPTSVEQDQEELEKLADEDTLESARKAHVLRVLLMEKQILKQTMDIALEDWKGLVFSSHPNLQEV